MHKIYCVCRSRCLESLNRALIVPLWSFKTRSSRPQLQPLCLKVDSAYIMLLSPAFRPIFFVPSCRAGCRPNSSPNRVNPREWSWWRQTLRLAEPRPLETRYFLEGQATLRQRFHGPSFPSSTVHLSQAEQLPDSGPPGTRNGSHGNPTHPICPPETGGHGHVCFVSPFNISCLPPGPVLDVMLWFWVGNPSRAAPWLK